MTSDEELIEIADTLGKSFGNFNQAVGSLAKAFRMAAPLNCIYCKSQLRITTVPNSNTPHYCCKCCEEKTHPDAKVYEAAGKVDKPV